MYIFVCACSVYKNDLSRFAEHSYQMILLFQLFYFFLSSNSPLLFFSRLIHVLHPFFPPLSLSSPYVPPLSTCNLPTYPLPHLLLVGGAPAAEVQHKLRDPVWGCYFILWRTASILKFCMYSAQCLPFSFLFVLISLFLSPSLLKDALFKFLCSHWQLDWSRSTCCILLLYLEHFQ